MSPSSSVTDHGTVADHGTGHVVGTAPERGGVARAATLVRRLDTAFDWRSLVEYGSGDERWYRQLDVDPDHDVWLISWLPGQRTGLHDHAGALGAFTVVQGVLTETTALVDPADQSVRTVERRFQTGQVRAFGNDHIHDVANLGDHPAVSIHAYAPELTAMTRYVLEAGRLRVVSSERSGVDW